MLPLLTSLFFCRLIIARIFGFPLCRCFIPPLFVSSLFENPQKMWVKPSLLDLKFSGIHTLPSPGYFSFPLPVPSATSNPDQKNIWLFLSILRSLQTQSLLFFDLRLFVLLFENYAFPDVFLIAPGSSSRGKSFHEVHVFSRPPDCYSPRTFSSSGVVFSF